jgi:hypothetical protein
LLTIIQRELEALARERMDDGRDIAARGLEIAATAGLTLKSRVAPREGTESQTILSEADSADVDLIICGSRGRGAVARSLLGSTSTSVLHHATRPVLVVPTAPRSMDGPALIAYDGSAGARAAIAVTGRLLRGRLGVGRARLELVDASHVEWSGARGRAARRAARILGGLRAGLRRCSSLRSRGRSDAGP